MTENRNTSLPVDDRTLLRVWAWLQEAGVGFVLDRIPHDEFSLDPSEVVEYLANPEGFLSEAMGVSAEDYRALQAAGGAIQCHAQITSGRRCRNMLADACGPLSDTEAVGCLAGATTDLLVAWRQGINSTGNVGSRGVRQTRYVSERSERRFGFS